MGSAPAPGAVGRARAAHPGRVKHNLHWGVPVRPVRRGGAPNGSRGGCAPHSVSESRWNRTRVQVLKRITFSKVSVSV